MKVCKSIENNHVVEAIYKSGFKKTRWIDVWVIIFELDGIKNEKETDVACKLMILITHPLM